MLYVCVGDVMDVEFYICIMRRGTVGAHVCEMCVFHHANVVCFCFVCILWQSPMMRSA